MTGKDKKARPADVDTRSKRRSGIDIADAVKDMITQQYPGMDQDDAMRLAVMLTKAQLKGEI